MVVVRNSLCLSDFEHVICLATTPGGLGRTGHIKFFLRLGNVGQNRTQRLYCDLTESPFGDWYEPVEGYLVLPHGPGLGIDPDQGILDKLRVD